MRQAITIFCLLLFIAFFAIASTTYYSEIVHRSTVEADSGLKVLVLAAVAGVALAQFFYRFQIIQIQHVLARIGIGSVLGILIFAIVFFSENIMSTIQLTRAMRDPEVFSVIQGHCGIYSGRGLVRWYQLSLEPSIENRMNSFLFSNQCRLEHFLDLRNRQQLLCPEDALTCLDRWMLTFSKKGFWNYPTRKMFFEEAQRSVIRPGTPDADKKWIHFTLRDRDLENARPPLTQQARIGEEFNDLHHYFKLKDDYDNLVLTKAEFDLTEKSLSDDRSNTDEVVKFKDVRKEVNLILEKIPELEENLKSVQSKLNYNPSL